MHTANWIPTKDYRGLVELESLLNHIYLFNKHIELEQHSLHSLLRCVFEKILRWICENPDHKQHAKNFVKKYFYGKR
jgi:hypothetical protein